ncbi:MAG: hypothetical protein GC191_16885 [Azospirillum sp.]|nr:hypothetical protein [Azospirillum sp.]
MLAALPAEAHKLKVFAAASGTRIEGYAYFPGGGRAVGAAIEVFDPAGERLVTLATDATGGFGFSAARRVDHRIVVDGGDGHRAEFTVSAAELPGSLGRLPTAGQALAAAPTPAAVATTAPAATELEGMIDRAIARQVVPLRQALDQYHERVRVSDILGGIGMITGLFGGLCFWLGRRRPSGPPS